jgi:hypothetical protein
MLKPRLSERSPRSEESLFARGELRPFSPSKVSARRHFSILRCGFLHRFRHAVIANLDFVW